MASLSKLVAMCAALLGIVLLGGCAYSGLMTPAGAQDVVRGGELLEAGNAGAAVARFDAAVKANPGTTAIYVGIAAHCQKARRYDLMARYAEQGLNAVERGKKADRARLAVIAAAGHLQAGNADQALALAREAHALAPESHEVLNNLAYAVAETTDPDARDASTALVPARRMAVKAIEKATQDGSEPEVIGTYLDTLGWLDFKLRYFDSALDALTRAADKVPGEAVILYHLGRAYAASNMPEQARTALARSLQADPDLAPAREWLRKLPGGMPAGDERAETVNPLSGAPPRPAIRSRGADRVTPL